MKRRQLRGFDLKQINGFDNLIGVDEAGRGALAGPVVAAAVLVTDTFLNSPWAVRNASRINDSKQLTPEKRDELWHEFDTLAREGLIHASPGTATIEEIEQLNILGATKLAMHRALQEIFPPAAFAAVESPPELFSAKETQPAARSEIALEKISCHVLVDGLPLKKFPYPHTAIVKGDARSLCVAMASIIAKVTRDRLMVDLDARHPGYGFAQHKGYGTDEHRAAIEYLGRCAQHRTLFLRNFFESRADPAQLNLFAAENGF